MHQAEIIVVLFAAVALLLIASKAEIDLDRENCFASRGGIGLF
jgi:hypothetical protein